ncbi:MAG: recombinase family protein [Cyanobacteria bacterium P01_A01_bin.17]
MQIVAYLYQDITWEVPINIEVWGWEIDQVYQDFSPSRPQLQKLKTQIPHPDYLLFRRLEELGDSLSAVIAELTALEAGGTRVLAIEQNYQSPIEGAQPKFPSSLQLFALLEVVQTQQRSRKIRHGHAQNRLKGKPPPGRAPYGYRRGKERYVIDRSVAPVVRDFFNHFLLYGSLRGAVRHIAKRHGKKVSVSTGQRWLTSPVYRGDLLYQGQDTIPDAHPALLPREEAAQVDRLLRRNRRLAPRSASAPRSLAGIVSCADCKSAMTVSRVTTRRQTKEYLYLRPIACPLKKKCGAIAYPSVLEQTIRQICTNLPKAVEGVDIPIMNQLKQSVEAQISAKQEVLGQLQALINTDVLDPATAELRAYTVKTEISALKERLAQLPPVNLKEIAKTVSIEQFWLDLSESERRFYFREFIRQIEIVREGKDWSLTLQFIF